MWHTSAPSHEEDYPEDYRWEPKNSVMLQFVAGKLADGDPQVVVSIVEVANAWVMDVGMPLL